ncbi:hypothetical protein QL285_074640 [Trifolium repens]|nr:hypothetical protein QL285_074640 [Trifolium repens]
MFFKLIRSRRQENYMEDEATKGDARREIFHERQTRVHFQVIWMKSNLRKSKNPKILPYEDFGEKALHKTTTTLHLVDDCGNKWNCVLIFGSFLYKHFKLKVSILAWRLLRDRLPTKANLVSRGILAPDLHDCVTGCGGIETARHLFLSCSTFGSLWAQVRSWIGFSAVDAFSLSDHFVQFTYSTAGLRARRSFLQLGMSMDIHGRG